MKRALLIKMSSLGDVVHAMPAVSDAAAAGWQFDWVVEEAFADLPARHPSVARVLPIAWRRWRKSLLASRAEMKQFRAALREQVYDVVLDSQGLIKSAAVARLARGAERVGYDGASAREPLAARAYHRGVAVARAQHAVTRQRQLFAGALGYEFAGPERYGLESGESDAAPVCLFLHGTTWDSKHYPEALWQALIELAAADGYQVALTFGNEVEAARAERLAAHPAAVVWPKSSIAELVARIAGVRLVVGVDSGLTHLATALGVTTVGLYGSTDASLTGCRGPNARARSVVFECAPCLNQTCRFPAADHGLIYPPCYETLTAKEVWREAMDCVNAHRLQHI